PPRDLRSRIRRWVTASFTAAQLRRWPPGVGSRPRKKIGSTGTVGSRPSQGTTGLGWVVLQAGRLGGRALVRRITVRKNPKRGAITVSSEHPSQQVGLTRLASRHRLELLGRRKVPQRRGRSFRRFR